jgi:hypothetical protein
MGSVTLGLISWSWPDRHLHRRNLGIVPNPPFETYRQVCAVLGSCQAIRHN